EVVVFLADATTQRGNQRNNLLGRQKLVIPSLLNIKHLATQRQNRLELPITSLLSRPTRRVTLNDIDFRLSRILLLTISKLPRQPNTIKHTFPPRHLPSLPRSVTSPRSINNLPANNLRVVRRLEQ